MRNTLFAFGFVLYALWLLACAAPGQVGVRTPQAAGAGYPPRIETTTEQQQAAETAWSTFLAEYQLPATKFDAEPVLNTPRALPLSLAGRIKLSEKAAPLDELAAKDALRHFIERHAVLLSGGWREMAVGLKDLSLTSFSNEGAMYRAVYEQRSFPYPVAGGFGELMLVMSKSGTLLQWNSRLLPKLELPTNTSVVATELPDRFVGRTFSYNNIAGQPQTYRVTNRNEVVVKDLVVYPKVTGNRLSLHVAFPVEVGRGMTWTVYVDGVTGEELAVRQDFVS
jgi:hypothetical protein